MFAIYELIPITDPTKQVRDWAFQDGKTVEKRLLCTRRHREDAEKETSSRQKATTNEVYYQEIP